MGDESKMYDAVVRMVGELHGFERGFWREQWVDALMPIESDEIMKRLKAAHHHTSQLRDAINHYTLVDQPKELELDDGESHLRGMEAFAAGGMDAYNEARGYGVVEDGPGCRNHCPGCEYCVDIDPYKHM